MKQSKHTKRALLTSVLAMLLCMAMLVGSTFAWFTDSVTTGVNKIVAGNLDVELEHAVFDEEGNFQKWESVQGKSLFAETTLWEPGHTEVVYLKVKNAGTLALKYRFAVTVESEITGTSVNENTIKLSEHLVFGQTEVNGETDKYASREEVWADVDATKHLGEYTKENTLLPGTADAESADYVALVVYMPTTVGNEANYRGDAIPTIELGVALEAAQTPHEEDTFGENYDEAAEYALGSSARVDALVKAGYVAAGTKADLNAAVSRGEKIVLTGDINLGNNSLTIKGDATIDLNGYTLKPYTTGKDALYVAGGTVTVRNGTIESAQNTKVGNSAVFATGASNVTIENCILKTNSNQSYVVCTNGSQSLDSTIVIKNSIISAPTVNGRKGYALFAPAGNITFENCDVTGHIFICGGNVTLDGGTYTATGFNKQAKIWHKDDTISYVSSMSASGAVNMGDSIFVADRRAGYTLSGLTIRNITFNTEIPGLGTAYAIKYVDVNANGAESCVPYVIENNTFNQQIDSKDPVMFIDLNGTDLLNP